MAGLPSVSIRVDVAGMPDVIARVRGEVATAVRTVAATETDARVVARLFEIAALISQELCEAEGKVAVQTAPSPLRKYGPRDVPDPTAIAHGVVTALAAGDKK